MGLDEYSVKFGKFLEESIKEFSEKTNIKFNSNYVEILKGKLGSSFLIDEFSFLKNSKDKSEEGIEKARDAAYTKSLKEFSTNFIQDCLYQDGEVGLDFKLYPEREKNNYKNIISKEENGAENFLEAFNTFINKISLAYLAEHELSKGYHSYQGALNGTDLATILAPFGEKNVERVNLQEDYKEELTYNRDKSSKMISDINNFYSKIVDIKNGVEDDDLFRTIIDNSYERAKDENDIIDHKKPKVTREEKSMICIERFATVYTALREKYHKNNSFLTNWFTPTGWKESKKINEMRDNMMGLLGYDNRDKFNKDMEAMSKKGNIFTKNVTDMAQRAKDTYEKNSRKLEKDVFKMFEPVKEVKKLVEVPEKDLGEVKENNKIVKEEKVKEVVQVKEIEQEEINKS